MSRSHYQIPPQVLVIGRRGFSLLLDEVPVFLSFRDYPAFVGATADELRQIHRPSIARLRWPTLRITIPVSDLLAKGSPAPASCADDNS